LCRGANVYHELPEAVINTVKKEDSLKSTLVCFPSPNPAAVDFSLRRTLFFQQADSVKIVISTVATGRVGLRVFLHTPLNFHSTGESYSFIYRVIEKDGRDLKPL
jgi:hypothetical protein